MAGVYKLVVRDFLGLGLMEGSADIENPTMSSIGNGNHRTFPHIFVDAETAPLLAPRHDKHSSFFPSHPVENGTACRNDMSGLKQWPWAKSFPMPYVPPLRSLQESKPDAHPVPASIMHAITDNNQQEAFNMKAKCYTAHRTDNSILYEEECGSGGFGKPVSSLGTLMKHAQFLSPAASGHPSMTFSEKVQQFPWPVLGGFQLGTQARMVSSDSLEKQTGSQLTIFYRGNVNVYDDILPNKAQLIMNYTESISSNLSGSLHENGERQDWLQPNAQDWLQPNAQPPQIHASPQLTVDQTNQCLPANQQMDCLQPAVPKALPLARKASLVRFLEKRRERVHLKAPYPMTKGEQAGERLSSSNYASTPCDESVNMALPLPCGVEGMAEHSPGCEMSIKEETSVGDSRVCEHALYI